MYKFQGRNGKAGKAAALTKFSDMLKLSQLGQIMHTQVLRCLKKFCDYAPKFLLFNEQKEMV